MKRIVLIIIFLGVVLGGFLWMRHASILSPVISGVEIPTQSGITSTMELANSIWSQDVRWKDVIAKKSQEAETNPTSLKDLAFAQSFTGDLRSAEATLEKYCQKNSENGACRKIEYVFDIQEPVDNAGKALSGLTFEVLGKSATAQKITKAGTVSDMAYKNTVLRTKISKQGYTDFIAKSMHIAWDENTDSQQKVAIKPVMIPADIRVVKKNSESYQVKTKNYTFTVQPDTFVYPDGSLVEGDVVVYFFDITANTQNAYASGMFSLDAFNMFTGENMGEGMETYGMPLVKAYKGDIELYTKQAIIGVGRMSNMDNFQKSYGPIDFTKTPKRTPLDFATASQYGLPPFWQYQKRTGIWETSTFQVLDDTGLSQFSFQDL